MGTVLSSAFISECGVVSSYRQGTGVIKNGSREEITRKANDSDIYVAIHERKQIPQGDSKWSSDHPATLGLAWGTTWFPNYWSKEERFWTFLPVCTVKTRSLPNLWGSTLSLITEMPKPGKETVEGSFVQMYINEEVTFSKPALKILNSVFEGTSLFLWGKQKTSTGRRSGVI